MVRYYVIEIGISYVDRLMKHRDGGIKQWWLEPISCDASYQEAGAYD